jgi:alpha-beta hydrolase superfamily lysophospholipase
MRVRGLLLVVALLGMTTVACTGTDDRRASEDVVEHLTEGKFYDAPDPLPAGDPGSIIKVKRLLGAPNRAIAWRVMYHSRDIDGADIAASGVVVAPTGPAPRGGRTIVSWGHPTTGAARRCAPSIGLDPFILIEGLRGLLDDGYVVAAADYPGMGVAGPAAYLIGRSEGNSVLDAARAARSIRAAHGGDRLLLWGHSQGGQATLFAAQDARRYAPDLHLAAVAVAAPAAELGDLLNDDIGDVSGVTIGSYAFDAFRRVYAPDKPGALSQILTPAGVAATPEMASLCLFGQNKQLHTIARPLIGGYVAHNPSTVEPWRAWLTENTPGATRINEPVLVAQGESDTLVRPQTTTAFVAGLCAAHEAVRYREYPGISHALVAVRAVPLVRQFFAAALAGHPMPSTCPNT